MREFIISSAKKTFVAQKNPYQSVAKVFMKAIDEIYNTKQQYLGVKDVKQIPKSLIVKLSENGYIKHTLDTHALGGRAIDLNMINPITGNYMTGSSSGTAVNVFLGINDMGIGTDGGGSVLAPAMSLNLFSMISPLIEQEHMQNYKKTSTDNIGFYPSIGFMTRSYEELIKAIKIVLDVKEEKFEIANFLSSDSEEFVDIYADRDIVINFLMEKSKKVDFIISNEGPVDVIGFGDSVFGHFDELTKAIQKKAKKGLIRVCNMANLTAITIPNSQLGCATVLMCESKIDKIGNMLAYAREYSSPQSKLIKQYFLNHNLYFESGFENN